MKKVFRIVATISIITLSAGVLAGCGKPVSGDTYRYAYVKKDQDYVEGSDNGGTSLSGLIGKICIKSNKKAYINDLLYGGLLYHSGSGSYEINNNNFTINLDKSFKYSNSSSILANVSADSKHIYIPIDMQMDEIRTFTKMK